MIKRFNIKIIRFLMQLKKSLNNDRENSRMILRVYSQSFLGEVSSLDIKNANEALVTILKKMGVGSFLIFVPFSLFMFPIILKFSRYYGVDLLPEDFKFMVKTQGINSLNSEEEQSHQEISPVEEDL